MYIRKDVLYVGVTDRNIDLFEGLYKVPDGITYNSYVIIDKDIAVLDTVDKGFTAEWLCKLNTVLNGKEPKYLVIHHMEPDHSASITAFLEQYPNTTVVSSKKSFSMIKSFYSVEPRHTLAVRDGDVLSLGEKRLSFISAPMVHWPEVTVSLLENEGILFSADAFGKFGMPDGEDNWAEEGARYYIGIVGKYGVQVQNLLNKLASYKINTICPLHGPVLTDSVQTCLALYDKWSKYERECDGVVIAYASIYGNTKRAALMLYDTLRNIGVKVKIFDLSRDDKYLALSYAFRYSKCVIAAPTYNATLFPPVRHFLEYLKERGYKKRTVAVIENGTWAPVVNSLITKELSVLEDIKFLPSIKIFSAVSRENEEEIKNLALLLK